MERTFRSVRRRRRIIRITAQMLTAFAFPFLVFLGTPGSVSKVWQETHRGFCRLISGHAFRRMTLQATSGGTVTLPPIARQDPFR